jgi:preprotein translocase subunit SecG
MLGFLSFLIAVVSAFLIVLILVQRGKGGGLAGAFGGAGGQSAFGTKAGDMFTKITAVTACIWIVLCAGTTWYMGHSNNNDLIGDDLGGQAVVEEGEAGINAVADEAAGDVGEGANGGDAAPAGDAPSDTTTDGAASAADDPPAADPPAEEGS